MAVDTLVANAADAPQSARAEQSIRDGASAVGVGVTANELVAAESARRALETLKRVYVNQDPLDMAQKIAKHIPKNGNKVWPGYWPAFKGHHFETLNVNLYNWSSGHLNKYLTFVKPGLPHWDGVFIIDDKFAGMFQVKLGIKSINKAIDRMKEAGLSPERACLFVPRDKLKKAKELANGLITVKAAPITSERVHKESARGINKLAGRLGRVIIHPRSGLYHHIGLTVSNIAFSVGVGTIIDEIQVRRGKITRHDYGERRLHDVFRGLVSYAAGVAGKAAVVYAARFGLRFAATKGIAAAALTSPVGAIAASVGLSVVAGKALSRLWEW